MDCIFCNIVKGISPSYKIYEDDLLIGIMDIDPACDGHILLIPKKHYTDMMELDEKIILHMNEVTKKLTPEIMEKLDKKSMTVSYNYGERQVVKHFHMHLLPDLETKPTHKVEEIYEKLK